MHPNQATNGVWIRDRFLIKRQRNNNRINPAWSALRRYDPRSGTSLARSTHHYDTYRSGSFKPYRPAVLQFFTQQGLGRVLGTEGCGASGNRDARIALNEVRSRIRAGNLGVETKSR